MLFQQVLWIAMSVKAKNFLKLSPVDIYSAQYGRISSPTREHIIPKKYLTREAAKDPHNIFICTSLVNSLRGVLPYGNIGWTDPARQVIDGTTGLMLPNTVLGGPDVCVRNKTHWMPPFHARGPISRTCLYMWDRYPYTYDRFPLNDDVIGEWSLYPVEEWEKTRNKLIADRFGIRENPFVLQKN